MWISFLSFTSSLRKLNLGKLLNLSVPQFSYLKNGANNILFMFVEITKQLIFMKPLKQSMAHNKYSESISYCYSSRIVRISYLMLLQSTNPSRGANIYLTSNKYHIYLCIHLSNIIENLLSLRYDFMFCTFKVLTHNLKRHI